LKSKSKAAESNTEETQNSVAALKLLTQDHTALQEETGALKEKVATLTFELESMKDHSLKSIEQEQDAKSKLSTMEAEAREAEESFTTLQGQYDNVVGELASLRDEVTGLNDAKEKLENQINLLSDENNVLKSKSKAAESNTEETQNSVAALKLLTQDHTALQEETGALKEKVATLTFELESMKDHSLKSIEQEQDAKSKLSTMEAEAREAEESFTTLQGQYDNVVGELASLRDEVTGLNDAKEKLENQTSLQLREIDELQYISSCAEGSSTNSREDLGKLMQMTDGAKNEVTGKRKLITGLNELDQKHTVDERDVIMGATMVEDVLGKVALEGTTFEADFQTPRATVVEIFKLQKEIQKLRWDKMKLESEIESICNGEQDLKTRLDCAARDSNTRTEEFQALTERLELHQTETEKSRQESKLLQEKNADLVLQLSVLSEEINILKKNSDPRGNKVQSDQNRSGKRLSDLFALETKTTDSPKSNAEFLLEIETLNRECEKWKSDSEKAFSDLEATKIVVQSLETRLQDQEELQSCHNKLLSNNTELIAQRDELQAKSKALEVDVKESRQILEEAAIDIDHMNQDIGNLEVENERLISEIEELMEEKNYLMEKNMDIQFQLAGNDGDLACLEETPQDHTSLQEELEQLRMYNGKIEHQLEHQLEVFRARQNQCQCEKLKEDDEAIKPVITVLGDELEQAGEVIVTANDLKKDSSKIREAPASGIEFDADDQHTQNDNCVKPVASEDPAPALEHLRHQYADLLDDNDKLRRSNEELKTKIAGVIAERDRIMLEVEKDTVSTSPESERSVESQRSDGETMASTDNQTQQERDSLKETIEIMEEEGAGNNAYTDDHSASVSAMSDLHSQKWLLEQAMDYRDRRENKQSSWSLFSSQRACASDAEHKKNDREREDLIDKLIETNDLYQETIMTLKSEIVELNKSLKDDAYSSKKKLDVLEQENLAHNLKISVLENELERLRKEADADAASDNMDSLKEELESVQALKQQADRETVTTKNYLYSKQNEIEHLQKEQHDLKAKADALENIIIAINDENSTLRDIAKKATSFSFDTELGKDFQRVSKNVKIQQLNKELIDLRMKAQEKLKNQAVELEHEKQQMREAIESHYTLLDEEHQNIIQDCETRLQARELTIKQIELELEHLKPLARNSE